jgi:hypothetical protein
MMVGRLTFTWSWEDIDQCWHCWDEGHHILKKSGCAKPLSMQKCIHAKVLGWWCNDSPNDRVGTKNGQ